MEFLERTGYTHSWSEEMHCLVIEKGWNGEFIEWDYWTGLSNITPNQAARLYWCIDPIKWPDNEYAQGTIADDLQEKILRLTQWLESRGTNWCLNELANALGLDNLPHGMAEALKKQRLDVTVKDCSQIQPVESLTDADWQNNPSLTKLEKQRKAIVEVIKLKQFDPMQIPDGEKGTIEKICRAEYTLLFDTDSSFSTAWKNARNLFRMANHAGYAKRGKQ